MGGWRGGQDETMPDHYLRDSQVLVLETQEKLLTFLREGGDSQVLHSVPYFSAEWEPIGSHVEKRGAPEEEFFLPDEVDLNDDLAEEPEEPRVLTL
jgi:hypothetical protein